jgi:hypothetical protein
MGASAGRTVLDNRRYANRLCAAEASSRSTVATEDPALNRGPNKVTMWSYPIIRNGLIYVIDIRNGLYILRYTGSRRQEVADIHFLEGNSNLSDAVRLARVGR